jgi:hypothetical protein
MINRAHTMTELTRTERAFFAVVALSALWVGSWAFFVPAFVQNGIPWFAPPLHARFIGSIYLSAAVFCAGAAMARSVGEIRAIPPMIAIWTGVVFVVSLLHLAAEDYRHPPLWIWLIAYLAYPLIALRLGWTLRSRPDQARGAHLPLAARGYLALQGLALCSCGLVLLWRPSVAVGYWPWKLTPLLAQVYAGPFLCYGFGSLLLASYRTFGEARLVVLGSLVFALGASGASVLHRNAFDLTTPSAWLWFGTLASASLALFLIAGTGFAASRRSPARLPENDGISLEGADR